MASDEMLLRRFSCLDLCRIGISYKTNICVDLHELTKEAGFFCMKSKRKMETYYGQAAL